MIPTGIRAMDDSGLPRLSMPSDRASWSHVSNESIDATNIRTEDDPGNRSGGCNLVEVGWIDRSLECSSVEQDPAPLERLLGDGIMSPISVRRDSYEVWSSMKKDKQLARNNDSDSVEEQSIMPGEDDRTSECADNDEEKYVRSLMRDDEERALKYSVSGSDEERGMMATHWNDNMNLEEIAILEIDDRLGETSDLRSLGGSQSAEGADTDFAETPHHRHSNPEGGKFCHSESMDDVNPSEYQDEQADMSMRSLAKALNESTGSAFTVDISSTKKKIDESSHAFMEQLRGAANRRRDQVIRSRDSLRAKQKQRKDTAIDVKPAIEIAEENAVKRGEIQTIKPFKALPMPSASGSGQAGVPKVCKRPQTTPFSPLLGARREQKVSAPSEYGAGQVGVPMIEKRPPTTPFSPLLGAKRLQKVVVPALQKPPPLLRRREKSFSRAPHRFKDCAVAPRVNAPQTLGHSFKARPLPSGFRHSGAGDVGIPKISKRPPTVALSPMLGIRRKEEGAARSHTVFHKSDSSINSLVGLDLLSPCPGAEIPNLENVQPAQANTPVQQRTNAYVPHSTKRAQERAQYNRLRAENEAKQAEELKLLWKREIVAKRSEIAKLREKL